MMMNDQQNMVIMSTFLEPSSCFQEQVPIYDLADNKGNYLHLLVKAAYYLDHNSSSPSSSFSSSSSGYSSCIEQSFELEAKESSSQVAKYQCEVCSKDFRKKPDLKRHLDFHNNNKPNQCMYTGCKRAFTLKSDLKKHIRIHTKEKPFFCKWKDCDYKAADRSSVTGHIRVRHFNLPRNRSEQKKKGIVDERDAKLYLGNDQMKHRVVSKSKKMMLKKN